ncbi:MAG: hypothetical protein MZV64_43535 [Ignavibacteriales bacterium]|nr:hypothetical protein [Ignavibacteriales bacterium]
MPFEGRGDVDAEARIVARRHGIDGHAEPQAAVLVGDQIFAPIREDPVVADPGQAGDLVGEEAGAVDDPAGGERSPSASRAGTKPSSNPTASTGASSSTSAPFRPGATRPGRW